MALASRGVAISANWSDQQGLAVIAMVVTDSGPLIAINAENRSVELREKPKTHGFFGQLANSKSPAQLFRRSAVPRYVQTLGAVLKPSLKHLFNGSRADLFRCQSVMPSQIRRQPAVIANRAEMQIAALDAVSALHAVPLMRGFAAGHLGGLPKLSRPALSKEVVQRLDSANPRVVNLSVMNLTNGAKRHAGKPCHVLELRWTKFGQACTDERKEGVGSHD